jgi:DNA-binding MarR family transcriptional regulator
MALGSLAVRGPPFHVVAALYTNHMEWRSGTQVLSLYFEHKLKPSEKSVLMTLATFLGADGLYPSHDAIARACRYSVRTVIRALERGYELGLIERTHRRTRVEGRWVRTSNTYKLLIKATD